MAQEIERKFLVNGTAWRDLAEGVVYRQGYLAVTPERTVRVRIAGKTAFLTIKGKAKGLTRPEFEYEIPVADAQDLLDNLCEKPLIEKTRRKISFRGNVWEVDEFFGENAGLVIAEVELETENQSFEKPEWIAREVTGDKRYYNANLIANPFRNWKSDK